MIPVVKIMEMKTEPSTTPPVGHPTAQHADTLHVDYALKVRGREHVVCEIDGSAHMPYALNAEIRRDTAANFHKLLGLLLLQPALLQVNGFVNGLRRADIEARENASSGEAAPAAESDASLSETVPEAVEVSLPPDLSPQAPATVLVA